MFGNDAWTRSRGELPRWISIYNRFRRARLVVQGVADLSAWIAAFAVATGLAVGISGLEAAAIPFLTSVMMVVSTHIVIGLGAGAGGLDNAFRRRSRRLPDFQMEDLRPIGGPFSLVGGACHLHHVEGRDLGAVGDLTSHVFESLPDTTWVSPARHTRRANVVLLQRRCAGARSG